MVVMIVAKVASCFLFTLQRGTLLIGYCKRMPRRQSRLAKTLVGLLWRTTYHILIDNA